MPGLVGLITKMPREWAEPRLLKMLETQFHQSSFVSGTWVDESLGVYSGWTVRKNSFSDGMPLCSEQGDVTLLFSGEEYSSAEISPRLKEQGHVLAPKSCSYLVHWYEDDKDFVAKLNGRFQGLLVDRSRQRVMLFNDRYGIHRLYYHESGNAFYFASEAKAILAVCPELKAVDPRGLGEFVSCGCVLENRTLFRDIFLLPPASAWSFRGGSVAQKASYFMPQEWEGQGALEPETYYQQLRATFTRVLPRYFNGHERIGMSLTGGLDTRMILAWHKPQPGALPCYSFGGMFRECEDVKLAREVARTCDQSFEVIPVGQEFLAQFSKYAERTIYLTDGCATVRSASDLYVNTIAAKIAPVRMTGNYGGEILRQVRAFKPVEPAAGLFCGEFLSHVQETRKTFDLVMAGHKASAIAFRQVPWHHYALLSLEQTQVSLRSPYLDNDLVRMAFRAPGAATVQGKMFQDSDECVRLIDEGDAALRRIRTDRGLAGTSPKFVAHLTQQLLEFTFKAEYAYDYGMPQWLAGMDHRLSWVHLERLFLGRHKFNHFRVWYRDQLAGYVRDILLDSRSLARPYLNRRNVENIVAGHTNGERNYTLEIQLLLTLELIHRLFVDQN